MQKGRKSSDNEWKGQWEKPIHQTIDHGFMGDISANKITGIGLPTSTAFYRTCLQVWQ